MSTSGNGSPVRTPNGLHPVSVFVARSRMRAVGAALSAWLREAGYLRKWLVLGCLLGAIAGLGAVAFYAALRLATHLLLGELAGYQIPTSAGEGFRAGSAGFIRPWSIPLVVGLGGLLSAILVFTLAPEAEGHGTNAAIDAVHKNPRGVRARAVIVKIVASALTIGSGGSGGREGPTAQISSGFGSLLARTLDLSPADGRIAVAVGIGSGIGSIFSAPLGGALLSAEILYRDDIEVEAIIPAIIASVIGYTVFSAFMGFTPMFGYVGAHFRFTDPLQLAWYALIGVLGGLIGLGYAKGFYGIAGVFKRLALPRVLRPALGGVLVGLIALALPEVLGTGYGWIQKGLGPALLTLPLWAVVALPFAKILATSLSIGSGGSGGIFGPGIVIGAFTGAALWRVLEPIAPGVPNSPVPFVIVAMMATFGGISRAPLAVMLMVAEMTSSLTALAPAMIAVGLATLIVRRADDTIYRSQLRDRSQSPAHRLQAGMPLLASLTVAEFMTVPRLVLFATHTVSQAMARLRAGRLPGAPVIDQRGSFVGIVSYGRLNALETEAQGTGVVGRYADPTAPTVTGQASLDVALEALMHARTNWVPVLDVRRQVVGIVTTFTLVRGYRAALRGNLQQLSKIAPDTAVVNATLTTTAPLNGRSLREARLPAGTIVITLQRAGTYLLPRGDTILQTGDQLSILTHYADAPQVQALFTTPDETGTRQS